MCNSQVCIYDNDVNKDCEILKIINVHFYSNKYSLCNN